MIFFLVIVSSIRTKRIPRDVQKKCSTIGDLIAANLEQENIEILVQGLESHPIWIKGTIQANILDKNDENSKKGTIQANK
jgi:hypothetical protein